MTLKISFFLSLSRFQRSRFFSLLLFLLELRSDSVPRCYILYIVRVNDNVLFSRKNYQRGERTTDIEFLILNDNNSRFLEIIGKRYEKDRLEIIISRI